MHPSWQGLQALLFTLAPDPLPPPTPISALCSQVGFLTCLKEFADWLVARGASDGHGNRFALPCPIEGDKVGAAAPAVPGRAACCCTLCSARPRSSS